MYENEKKDFHLSFLFLYVRNRPSFHKVIVYLVDRCSPQADTKALWVLLPASQGRVFQFFTGLWISFRTQDWNYFAVVSAFFAFSALAFSASANFSAFAFAAFSAFSAFSATFSAWAFISLSKS